MASRLSMMQIATGHLLRVYRENAKLSQSEVMAQLGYANSNLLSVIENGRTNIPFKRITEFLEVYQVPKEMLTPIVRMIQPDTWLMHLQLLAIEQGQEKADALEAETKEKINKILTKNNMHDFLKFV
ncbi:MAG: helix-turn-helix domain-containing protein [Desulfamplus sp.]|nr:helix-turn-helix domain-containing protein [Desulfamplus sp.]